MLFHNPLLAVDNVEPLGGNLHAAALQVVPGVIVGGSTDHIPDTSGIIGGDDSQAGAGVGAGG